VDREVCESDLNLWADDQSLMLITAPRRVLIKSHLAATAEVVVADLVVATEVDVVVTAEDSEPEIVVR
jgi:hypothetical protein